MASAMNDSVILMVAPSATDSPYSEFFDDILDFFAGMIESSHPDDQFLVVVDLETLGEIGDAIPQQNLLVGSIPDIWIRDFAPVRTLAGNFKFRYLPAYLPQDEARSIDRGFMRWFRSVGLRAEPLDLILDGGNFVYNGTDSAVVTARVLQDNPSFGRDDIHRLIGGKLELDKLAIIPEGPREKTGHADGMVVWLGERLLGVARFEEPIRSRILGALEQSLPGADLVELPFEPTGETWQDWQSAGGIYVNALSTANALYVPQFGLTADPLALEIYRSRSSREVIPVRAGREVRMGGSVRCLTWDLTGPDAWKILECRDPTPGSSGPGPVPKHSLPA